jgi:hypothetical protein
VIVAIVALLVVGVIAVVVIAARRRRAADPVASFQRQIDALSPEARRPVIDQMPRSDDKPSGGDTDDRGDDSGGLARGA